MRTGPGGRRDCGSKSRASAVDDIEAVRIERGDFLQGGDRPFVALDRDHAGGAERQQRAREPARSGADFEYGHAVERSRGAGDARGRD